jgi:ATP-binding cassette subfamily B protein
MDCAPACLKMVAEYFGKDYSLQYLRDRCYLNREGVSLLSLNDAAENLGMHTLMANISLETLVNDAPLPCILHWNQHHYVVLYKVKSGQKFIIADPGHGIVKIDQATFRKSWISGADETGVGLFLEPTPDFAKKSGVKDKDKDKGYGFLFRYLLPYKKYVAQLIIGMIAASAISLIFPFLTQILIDNGVKDKNLSIITLILLSQLFLFLGSTAIDLIRSWLLLHVNTRVSLNIISDFLIKLLKLPIKYFDSKAVGDISQRVNDHHRIESFLTGAALTSLFSIINILVFATILFYYNKSIFFALLILSTISVTWVFLFQKRRKELDYKRFARNRENQDKLYEMITGMQEIKLFGNETVKRWEWERLQIKYFKLNIKSLTLEQFQQTGYLFFSQLKNIIIFYIAANAVVKYDMSLGALLSISYIIGQTNGPLEQLITFIKAAQDAKLSMDRLQEIHKIEDEDASFNVQQNINSIGALLHSDLRLKRVSFQYEGPNSPKVLSDITLTIPKGKITAIVGTSGSGKTTLLKLLLKYYNPVCGDIFVGDSNLDSIQAKLWRGQCGTVMQDGYIFFDTVARNIAFDGNPINEKSMQNAVKVANLDDFIGNLPLGFTTKIGSSGIGISGGQRQRILIARAVYKNPHYLFFDEATSSLDANNELVIMSNLDKFFMDKTVVIIAHRLSTVKNADQIIVMENGKIAETGNHLSLIKEKGKYYELVKNQLELGN